MLITVTGGSGSGKSEFAENLLLKLDGEARTDRFYIATMEPFGEEGARRIKRHRAMRRDKGFETVECYRNLKELVLSEGKGERTSALLECMSNLAANELFAGEGESCEKGRESAQKEIFAGIEKLLGQTGLLVVVTGEVFSDGLSYDASTECYRKLLGALNRKLAALSDVFVEVVYSIPLYLKGGPL
ncbi:MAG: bifunctional adenosylcobinamide kinase/adenosylcobinamide-phosphate guanylyltransferase [Lachnospiraceae bacterium]|jgi:adenosylcobinamide kinase/adenosylcobinamide-phosphate guanylyltransferase|nr:bifunctional adenosylcobinamide kinase/adenosylcobinamide-phosphate guanylyltransferase [Lachnospiraceae bacterium]